VATAFSVPWPARLLIVGAVPAIAAALARVSRRSPAWGRAVRLSLAAFLAADELVWYGFRIHWDSFRFPDLLPLQLCDLTLWLTVVAALTLRPSVYEFAYLAGLGGGSMALFTPELWAPFPSYPTIYFFLSHGMVVSTLLTLLWGRLARPQTGCVWRGFAWLNGYAAAVGIFNFYFHTNYLYLCEKPSNPTLLDYFGPWPVYIAVEEAVALAVFWLLWLPLRHPLRGSASAVEAHA
jgi:hypothetical integral membrane protein (TIGR02206 family)